MYNHNVTPIALIGGATGMIGDPSMKTTERSLLSNDTLDKNYDGVYKVLDKFLKLGKNTSFVNNYKWMSEFSFLDFIRDIGKNVTVNYMMSKESVKQRLNGDGEGMSFTEFTYQLIQGYDFVKLNETHGCNLQLGGSDQWGNMTTGLKMMETGTNAHCITFPLITKPNGEKFGKSESGTIWLTSDKTSVYDFYQFWLNQSDEDTKKYLKIFTFLSQDEYNNLISHKETSNDPYFLQKQLAWIVSTMVHSEDEVNDVILASKILFDKNASKDELSNIDTDLIISIFGDRVKTAPRESVIGCDIVKVLSEFGISKSNREAREFINNGAVYINKEKVNMEYKFENDLDGIFIVQYGKKNFLTIKLN